MRGRALCNKGSKGSWNGRSVRFERGCIGCIGCIGCSERDFASVHTASNAGTVGHWRAVGCTGEITAQFSGALDTARLAAASRWISASHPGVGAGTPCTGSTMRPWPEALHSPLQSKSNGFPDDEVAALREPSPSPDNPCCFHSQC